MARVSRHAADRRVAPRDPAVCSDQSFNPTAHDISVTTPTRPTRASRLSGRKSVTTSGSRRHPPIDRLPNASKRVYQDFAERKQVLDVPARARVAPRDHLRHNESLLVTGHPLAHHQEALAVSQSGGLAGRYRPIREPRGGWETAPVLLAGRLGNHPWRLGDGGRLRAYRHPPWGMAGSGECDQWGLVALRAESRLGNLGPTRSGRRWEAGSRWATPRDRCAAPLKPVEFSSPSSAFWGQM